VRRRKIDGCPIAGALQLIGDKWTMLLVRDLCVGPKRTTELLEDLHPISSRTLMGRLREMEQDQLILRNNYGGLPRRVEYELTERGRKLLPLLDALMEAGLALECNDCEDRRESAGYYCDFCPVTVPSGAFPAEPELVERIEPIRRPKDDSIVLL
jgi:DNA-binding HxlR family transcriptional regulator